LPNDRERIFGGSGLGQMRGLVVRRTNAQIVAHGRATSSSHVARLYFKRLSHPAIGFIEEGLSEQVVERGAE
jgi:hypothetical protein